MSAAVPMTTAVPAPRSRHPGGGGSAGLTAAGCTVGIDEAPGGGESVTGGPGGPPGGLSGGMSGAGVEQEGQAVALGLGQRRRGAGPAGAVLGEALGGPHGPPPGGLRVIGGPVAAYRRG